MQFNNNLYFRYVNTPQNSISFIYFFHLYTSGTSFKVCVEPKIPFLTTNVFINITIRNVLQFMSLGLSKSGIMQRLAENLFQLNAILNLIGFPFKRKTHLIQFKFAFATTNLGVFHKEKFG